MDLRTFRGKLSLFLIGTIVLSLAWIVGHRYRDYAVSRMLEAEEVVIEPAIAQSATNLMADAGLAVHCIGGRREDGPQPILLAVCQKLLNAISHHPSPEINSELRDRIHDGRIVITLESRAAGDVAVTVLRRNTAGTDDLVLNFSPEVFQERLNIDPDPLLIMVIYHEYQHVKQIEAAGEFREDFRYASPPTDIAGVVRRFGYELDAYDAQCRFGIEYHLQPTQHCAGYALEGKRGLTTYLIENNISSTAVYRQAVLERYAPWMLTNASAH